MEIEFIEQPGEDLPADELPAPAPRRSVPRWLELAPAPFFLAAAILAAMAPFLRLYRIAVTTGGFSQTLSYDGWGRLTATPATSGTFGLHGGRYGAVAEVLAGLSVLVALGCAVTAGRIAPRAMRHGVLVAGTVVTATLGVALAMCWLAAAADIDSTRRRLAPHVGRTLDDRFELRTGYGGCVWLLLAGTVCALLGTALLVRRARIATGLAGLR